MIVVDASLATKWFLVEAESGAARAFFRDFRGPLIAPDLMLSETGGALVRAANDKRIDTAKFADLRAALVEIWTSGAVNPVRVTAHLVEKAMLIATEIGHPLADCIYLALAIDLQCELVTCDMKFRDKALAKGRVRSLSDIGFASASH